MRSFLRSTVRIICLLLLIAGICVILVARPFIVTVDTHPSKILADPNRLRSHVTKLSEDFSPRSWQHPEKLAEAARYIQSEFSASNSRVSLQTFPAAASEYSNVLSEYGTGEGARIIIGAHYDAYSTFPGADDNASGIAGLLELSRMLGAAPVAVPMTLVAYPLEEPPFFRESQMGSAVHAASLAAGSVRLMVCLEMIGYFSESEDSQEYPLSLMKLWYPSRGNFIAIVDRFAWNLDTVDIKRAFLSRTTLPAVSINAPSMVPGIDFSDHMNYWARGFNAVMISDTAFYRNRAYHTRADVAARLDFERMAQVVNGVYGYLESLQ